MIDAKKLLAELQKLVKKLEDDMRRRCKETPSIDAKIRAQYEAAKEAKRTAQAYEIWRDDLITQSVVAWILGCVFVRFLEDNNLVNTPKLAGAKERLKLASDNHTLYFRQYPTNSDREYLESVFHEVAKLPGLDAIFDERHNPLWVLGPSGDGATELLNFWQEIDPTIGNLKRDFTDDEWNTRFLGDLYQDLSESAQKKYALKQTPIFVEEFILDRTLTPAIDEFGYQNVRLIDPTCGSGHFLLGAFDRLFNLYQHNEPGLNARTAAQNVLNNIYGIDINPFATAIAKFRLLLAALKASDIHQLSDAPNFKLNIATGDSLLHGTRPKDTRGTQKNMFEDRLEHYYEVEDKEELERILNQQYHAVVGNPPYITPKDPAASQTYRDKYGSCHRQYSLAVPFMERFFDLAIENEKAGYVGMITANSFMKREFGKKLIESFIPLWDLTHVIDTSGAYIPGHGTPTVIIFARHQRPTSNTIRTVMGIKGEPSTPENAADGLVWQSIISLIDQVESQDDFVSVANTPRNNFHKHPWSIGGGGAAELKELIEEKAPNKLGSLANSIGFLGMTHADEIMVTPKECFIRKKVELDTIKPLVVGEQVRNYLIYLGEQVFFPYIEETLIDIALKKGVAKWLWRFRTFLGNRATFSKNTYFTENRSWWEWHQVCLDRIQTPLTITFAEIATHNHFILDRGGKVFSQTSPTIKLSKEATEDNYLAVLGLLNSSIACFWGRQTLFSKRGDAVGRWGEFLIWNGTNLLKFPIPEKKPLLLAQLIDQLAQKLSNKIPSALIENSVPNKNEWEKHEQEAEHLLYKMIALQEELDWECYRYYGLLEENLNYPIDKAPEIKLGERAFEIIMARKMAEGELDATWFERHNSTPITEIPAHWPENYQKLVARRIEVIESDSNINLIERPEYKRRWNMESWESQQEKALQEWMLNRLEDSRYWDEVALTSCNKLADKVRQDSEFMQVAEFYRGRPDFDVANLVADLVKAESVPFLPVLRYKETGLRNRKIWEETWEKQRAEDKIDARTKLAESDPAYLTEEQANATKQKEVGTIAVPPKYKSTDFLDSNFWRLRGKLDVPKERFISYPHCQREADQSLVIAWAGWDHLQQAKAISGYIENIAKQEGWSNERIVPLLAGMLELQPWLEQWHNEIDPDSATNIAESFQSYIEEEVRAIGKTLTEVKDWKPVR